MKTNIAVFIVALSLSSPLLAQSQPGMRGWIDKQIDAAIDKQMVDKDVGQQNVGHNGKGSDRQKESPSADTRSTALVDESSATDFFSVAANVIPVTPGLSQFVSGAAASNSGAEGSTTATASLYSLLAGLNRVSPTDPGFYAEHIFARRISFTIGTAASTQAIDNTNTPATVYGAKVLLINDRELYKAKNLAKLKEVSKANANAAGASAKLDLQIAKLIYGALNPAMVDAKGEPADPKNFGAFEGEHLTTDAAFQETLNSLSSDTKKQIQALIQGALPTFADERTTLQTKYDEISKAPQLSVSYAADIRDAKGNNEHRVEMILDYSVSPRINWTVNASGDYTDRKAALDSKGGRLATSFQGDLTKSDSAWGKTPIRLTFSGEAKWQTSQKPQYTFESKLSIPLVPGVDLPIVYRYANRIAQINQTDSEARLGLSIDISRLAQALK
jgi:hypothetical protein